MTEFNFIEKERFATVNVEGSIDIYEAPELSIVIQEGLNKRTQEIRTNPILINLERVDYIDSSGIMAIRESVNKAKKTGTDLFVVNATGVVKKVIETVDLTSYFHHFNSIEEFWNKYFTEIDLEKSRIRLRIDEKGVIRVEFQSYAGTWTYADSLRQLPSGIYIAEANHWTNILKELEELVNHPQTKEIDLQKFFERHPTLLAGHEYRKVIPQACIIPSEDSDLKEYRADFILVPVDQNAFCKIIELKIPQVGTVKKSNNPHDPFYHSLHSAISQLRNYYKAFNDQKTRTLFKNKYGVEVFQPDLQLIIGKEISDLEVKKLLEFQREHFVKIDDWTTHLNKLKRIYLL